MDLKKFWMSAPEFMEISKEAESWESVGAWSTGGVNVAMASEPIPVTSARFTRELIETLGVQPAMGRNFTEEEDRQGGPHTALIADGLWRGQFGADPRDGAGRHDGKRAIAGVESGLENDDHR